MKENKKLIKSAYEIEALTEMLLQKIAQWKKECGKVMSIAEPTPSGVLSGDKSAIQNVLVKRRAKMNKIKEQSKNYKNEYRTQM